MMWYEKTGQDNDIVLATKAFVIRSINGIPFPSRMDDEDYAHVLALTESALKDKNLEHVKGAEMTPEQLFDLIENQVLVKPSLKSYANSAIYPNADRSLSVLINCGDHICIKVMKSGFDTSVVAGAEKMASDLESSLDIAYSEKYGFLNSSVNFVGTGMRIVFILSLPGVKQSNAERALAKSIDQVDWTLKPVVEDSASSLYIVRSKTMLGATEKDVEEKGRMLCSAIVKFERKCRDTLANRGSTVDDIYGRAYGTLRYGTLQTPTQALSQLSILRLYKSYDTTEEFDVPWEVLNKLESEIAFEERSAEMGTKGNRNNETLARKRAEKIKSILKGDD